MPDISSFCPKCGAPIAPAEQKPIATSTRSRILAALAYGVLPAILFLVAAPFKQDKFLRFHSIQSLLFLGAAVGMSVLLRVISFVLLLWPGFGLLLMLLILAIVAIGLGLVWLVLVIKAFQGQPFHLLAVGPVAERLI
jgi:uncharacterized membrane protein